MEKKKKKLARPAAARKIFSGRIFFGLFTDTTRLWAVELGYAAERWVRVVNIFTVTTRRWAGG